MYMYYFLGHQLMDNPSLTDAQKEVGQVIGEEGNCWLRGCCIKVRAENTFLLALDGDVDFQPEAIIKVSGQVFFSKLQAPRKRPWAGGRLDEKEPGCRSCLW